MMVLALYEVALAIIIYLLGFEISNWLLYKKIPNSGGNKQYNKDKCRPIPDNLVQTTTNYDTPNKETKIPPTCILHIKRIINYLQPKAKRTLPGI